MYVVFSIYIFLLIKSEKHLTYFGLDLYLLEQVPGNKKRVVTVSINGTTNRLITLVQFSLSTTYIADRSFSPSATNSTISLIMHIYIPKENGFLRVDDCFSKLFYIFSSRPPCQTENIHDEFG
jgi:hypothetical protein